MSDGIVKPWKLSITTQAALDAALIELRNESERLRDRYSEEFPNRPKVDYEALEADVDSWIEDLEAVVSELEQLNFEAPIRR